MNDLDSGQKNGLPENDAKVNHLDSELVCFCWSDLRKPSPFPWMECKVLLLSSSCALDYIIEVGVEALK